MIARRVLPKTDCWFSHYFYWHEMVNRDPDLDKLQRSLYLDISICHAVNRGAQMWLTSTDMPACDLGPLLHLYSYNVFHFFFSFLSESSSELKELLANRHLRDMLVQVNSSNQISRDIEQAMQEPIFCEFASQCLEIVKNGESANNAPNLQLPELNEMELPI